MRVFFVWYHRLSHFTFNCLLRLFKRVIISKKLSMIRKLSLTLPDYLGIPRRGNVVTKANTKEEQ